ncbi:MAG: poly(R)-hydroxyalkanoic acid synthase subunit PhaE [Tissierellia bacterium]|nr:poly(R)-hydroxyalkanoic acid synthase subunit PhaE [Tissierellia bacterium]
MNEEKNFYNDWKKMQEDFMKLWFPWSPSKGKSGSQESMLSFPSSQNFMNSMMEMWKNIMKNPTADGITSDFFQDSTTNFYSLMLNSWMPFKQPSGFFSKDNIGMKGFQEMMSLWNKSLEGVDFFSQLPPLGPGREMIEKQKQMMESFETYRELWMKGMYLIQNFGIKSGQRIYQEYVKALQEGRQFYSFEAFYDFWMEETRREYELLMKEKDFQELMKEITDAMAIWKEHSDDYMEDVLAFYPIPTMKAFDSLSKSVYDLKSLYRDEQQKKIDELEERIKKLEGKLK